MEPKKKKFDKAMGDITSLTDSGLDERLNAMAAAKAPPPELEAEGMEPEAGELSPDEVEKLRQMLAQMEG